MVRVELDAQRLAGFGLTVDELARALQAANVVQHAGALVGGDRVTPWMPGSSWRIAHDVAGLVVGAREGRPVFLEDVADDRRRPGSARFLCVARHGPGRAQARALSATAHAPAVTIAMSKKPGENAIDVARSGDPARASSCAAAFIPAGVEVTVTRNYGVTANDKAKKLIQKLLFATASVVLLVVLAMGRREAMVVGAAVIVTLAATLFASWAWGFTINRVSLFALIFSIGILVDDAIVIVENIHRHMRCSGIAERLAADHSAAVDEVGGPTILATFTVIAALLPMAFVSGLMGPYMSPDSDQQQHGHDDLAGRRADLHALAVPHAARPRQAALGAGRCPGESGLQRLFERFMRPFLVRRRTRAAPQALLGSPGAPSCSRWGWWR